MYLVIDFEIQIYNVTLAHIKDYSITTRYANGPTQS